MTDQDKKTLVVGLGVSGMSVVRFLSRHQCQFEVAESNVELLEARKSNEPLLNGVKTHTQSLASEFLGEFDSVVVSPGVSVRSPEFVAARNSGVEIIGDVELFARHVDKPVIAVTGSNGKSTVVSMAGALLEASGLNASVVGNVGFACLDSLQDDSVDVFVLELSSFQLETTFSLRPVAATVLNVSADHLDRYDGMEDYAAVKRLIYKGSDYVVFNAEDELTRPGDESDYRKLVSFSSKSEGGDWWLDNAGNEGYLCGSSDGHSGEVVKVSASDVRTAGIHNRVNALAAMALTSNLIASDKETDNNTGMGQIFSTGLAKFTGLPHRTSLVCESGQVSWINDSKGTNVGACVSAITGMTGPVILIAGGRGKNADYEPLRNVVAQLCKAVLLIGEDAEKINAVIADAVPVYHEVSLADAVRRASILASPGDCVLLSPACASFDMFKNFEDRGCAFESEVKKLCA